MYMLLQVIITYTHTLYVMYTYMYTNEESSLLSWERYGNETLSCKRITTGCTSLRCMWFVFVYSRICDRQRKGTPRYAHQRNAFYTCLYMNNIPVCIYKNVCYNFVRVMNSIHYPVTSPNPVWVNIPCNLYVTWCTCNPRGHVSFLRVSCMRCM